MDNKATMIEFGKVSALVLLGLMAIISNVAVWNACSVGCENGFATGVSVLNLLAEGFGIYKLARKWFPNKK